MAISSSVHDLKSIVLSFHSAIAIETVEEERVDALLDAVAAELGFPVFEWSVTRGLVQRPTAHANLNTKEALGALGHMRGLSLEAIYLMKDFARHLGDPAVCREFRDVAKQFSDTHSTIVITGTGHAEIPADADSHILHYELAMPGKQELGEVVGSVMRSLKERRGVSFELSKADLDRLLDALVGMTNNQARQVVADAVVRDGRLTSDDIDHVLDQKAKIIGQDGLLEYYPAEDNVYELGGFQRLKQWLARAQLGFSEEARELNLTPPRGILMVGVQGCGKSLAAKCIAREWGLPLLKLDAGRLFSKWAGESERNMRRAIELAESMSPAVLWIDEIEKAFAGFGSSENDGGTSGRIFATFLSWMQEKEKAVFLVATANDVFKLPPELMRKGRFDEIFFVDLPDDTERATIFEIHLRKRKQDPATLDVASLVAASAGFSGAEIEQAVISSLYRSLHDKKPLDTATLQHELAETVPLSRSRSEDIARLRQLASERFVPVR